MKRYETVWYAKLKTQGKVSTPTTNSRRYNTTHNKGKAMRSVYKIIINNNENKARAQEKKLTYSLTHSLNEIKVYVVNMKGKRIQPSQTYCMYWFFSFFNKTLKIALNYTYRSNCGQDEIKSLVSITCMYYVIV